jgi:hypothetical protein
MTPEQRTVVTRHITHLMDDSKTVAEGGNKHGSAYLACIAGMWANHCKLDFNFPYTDGFSWLNDWFRCGYDAYNQSLNVSAGVRKKQLDYEKKQNKKYAEERSARVVAAQKEEKSSIWSTKLW